jgi:hypothetical protein
MLDHEAAFCREQPRASTPIYLLDAQTMPRRHPTPKPKHRARAVAGTLPDDLYDYIEGEEGDGPTLKYPTARHTITSVAENWTVSDDWPERVPVTEAEIDLFEAWFGDILDELFGKPG